MANTSQKDDFYIGWQRKAGKGYARAARNFAVVSILLVIVVMAALVSNQKGFVDSVFEFGNVKTLEGTLVMEPVPMLKVGKEHILLIGLGKFGAEPTLEKIFTKEKISLQKGEGLQVKLKGTLIYSHGKRALELTDEENSLVESGEKVQNAVPVSVSLGNQSLKGEILDPKCALGVMKPGYGKPHRSCAIRCISGGIPPLMRVQYADGQLLHALVLGENGEKINGALLPYIADQVLLCGELMAFGDWFVIQTGSSSQIQRLGYYGIDDKMSNCGEK